MQITLSDVGYTYPDAVEPLFSHVSITFPQGWSGLLGDNGCGKTTLARIAAGQLTPQTGSVSTGHFCALCTQETDTPPDALVDFALDYGREARHLRAIFCLDDDMFWRFDTLSHGERKKIQIAVALWQRPDVLVLDEPTNHIDHESRMQLIQAMQTYRGIGILVSHDRELLDAVVTRCVSFEDGKIIVRPGGYTAAHTQEMLERETTRREAYTARKQLARLSEEKDARAHEADRAQARRSKRHIDPKDRSAKAKIDLAIFTGQDGARGKLSAQLDARLTAAQNRVEQARIAKRYDGELWFEMHPSERKTLVTIEPTTIPCGSDTLAIPQLFVGNTDHVGIAGPNGAGKSTLLTYIRSLIADDLTVLTIPQEVAADKRAQIVHQTQTLSPSKRGQVLSIVAQLNSQPKRILEGDRVSPGELRKLMLALGMLEDPDLIIMDEPTNHLDLHSIEALEHMLSSYPGALLLVSHDHAFLHACTSRTWIVKEGRVHEEM